MKEKRLLITGFDPFGGESINPAWEAVRALPERIGPYLLTKVQIPTVFGKAAQAVLAAAQEARPDVILCVGQAGKRSAVTPERVAINLRDAGIPDNEGNQPRDLPCVEGGPDAYFATVPVKAMAQAMEQGQVSLSAGSFVCNDILYCLLHHYRGTRTRVGFLHVPYLPQQAPEGVASMELADIVKNLIAAIGALD